MKVALINQSEINGKTAHAAYRAHHATSGISTAWSTTLKTNVGTSFKKATEPCLSLFI